ncbi:ferredoxin [Couchioplanes caeruleus]|uniref:Ferredoxin n=2 Tax=Couchioplanes caeruleus TaxID=56438 RepID=A0A1K0H3J4_9ACTN|nr:ferredoxin [Couchioplanes caeruleus]AGM21649.1 ferredoxin [Couchioplanes caeruleus]OJF16275.1 AceM [Couchioplanes caeruleus subsp. caeruleus]ROP28371.1 ferredoxin [Couchioplanes caeruleus]
MRITVSTQTCVGAGQCVLSAPDVFDQDDDGVVEVLDAEPGAGHAEAVYLARDLCPAGAVTVED